MWSSLKAWQVATRDLSSTLFQNLMSGTAWLPSVSSTHFRGAELFWGAELDPSWVLPCSPVCVRHHPAGRCLFTGEDCWDQGEGGRAQGQQGRRGAGPAGARTWDQHLLTGAGGVCTGHTEGNGTEAQCG